ncbi:hypothetical protein AFL01nite_08800 [Aeromicrobium flavum]|uniref:Signal peptidase I n=2 Tax=Aeromicrobium flavum TaxID=416568 RepID=A0A512HSW5_9ACTN|nr:hypothetical protein AFL01nite_08800 [Aeromicrobium flavum]
MRTNRARRPLAVLAALAAATTVALLAPTSSSATFTSTSGNTASVRAAADWTPPTVAVTSPGAAVQGAVTIAADATDAGAGVKSVTIEYAPVGSGTWTALCTDTTAPYSCPWSTTGLADGQYDLRARAVDLGGYEATSASVRTAVANKLLVVMNDPGDVVRGTVPLSASVFGAGTLSHTVRLQYRVNGSTNAWTNACSGLVSPYTCSWNTGTMAGDYELRAQLVAGTSVYGSEVVPDVTVDNVAPSVTMTDPGSPLSGTRTFAAAATDAHSGVATVAIQAQLAGGTWKTICSLVEEPWSCRVATTDLVNGTYAFRAIATDEAGNTTTSTTVANRVVDNTISSVSLNDPGVLLHRTATLTAEASSTAGVTSVRIQSAPSGGSTWTDVCTDTTAPYSCAWDTTRVASGGYDLRAVLLDGKGATTVSATESTIVDNSPLAGADVQAFNGSGSVAGQLGANDTIAFTYTTQINPATVLSGWNGAATNVRVRLRDGALMWRLGSADSLEVYNAAGSAALGLGEVNLKGDYVKYTTVFFDATMTASTVTVNGLERSVVTVRLGSLASGKTTSLKTVTTSKTMTWAPSNAVTDLFGNRSSTTTITESGTADRDF